MTKEYTWIADAESEVVGFCNPEHKGCGGKTFPHVVVPYRKRINTILLCESCKRIWPLS